MTTRPIIEIKDESTIEMMTAARRAYLLLRFTTDSMIFPSESRTVLSNQS